mmetsp:Transcript_21135/g.51030  ORF Transcript_21135/g.51030 Transcript_21135/m.51030 type:complete len:200 (+) Transcript_21135:3739-4338(+)
MPPEVSAIIIMTHICIMKDMICFILANNVRQHLLIFFAAGSSSASSSIAAICPGNQPKGFKPSSSPSIFFSSSSSSTSRPSNAMASTRISFRFFSFSKTTSMPTLSSPPPQNARAASKDPKEHRDCNSRSRHCSRALRCWRMASLYAWSDFRAYFKSRSRTSSGKFDRASVDSSSVMGVLSSCPFCCCVNIVSHASSTF